MYTHNTYFEISNMLLFIPARASNNPDLPVHTDLKEEHTDLKEEHTDLKEAHTDLKEAHTDFNELRSDGLCLFHLCIYTDFMYININSSSCYYIYADDYFSKPHIHFIYSYDHICGLTYNIVFVSF